jgi:hypothetical protein
VCECGSLSLTLALFRSVSFSLAVCVGCMGARRRRRRRRENEICESGREGRVVGRAERGRQQRSAASSTSAKTVSLLFVRNGRSSTLHPHVSSHHRHRLLPRWRWSQSSIPTHAVRAHSDLVAPSCIHQAGSSPRSSTCPGTVYCS